MDNASGRRNKRIALGILIPLTCYMTFVCVEGRIALALVGHVLVVPATTVDEIYTNMIGHGVAAALCAIGALHIWRKRSIGPKVPKVAVLIALVMLIVSGDRIVSVFNPPSDDGDDIFMPHAERGWFHWPNVVSTVSGRHVQTNSLGFCSPEIPLDKTPGEFRALFIGDSITFGFGASMERGYVHQTEMLLRKACPDRKINAINAGVCGYATWQELDLLQNEGMRLDPDLVILTYCMNDMTDLVCKKADALNFPRMHFKAPRDEHWSGFIRVLRSYYTRQRMKRIGDELRWNHTDIFDGKIPALKTWEDVYREPPVPEVKEAWRSSLEELGKVDALCRSKGLPWVLVFCPTVDQLGPDAIFEHPEWRLRDWASRNSIPYVDIRDVFEKDIGATGLSVYDYMMDSLHPTEMGYRLMAKTVVRFLDEHHLPPFGAEKLTD